MKIARPSRPEVPFKRKRSPPPQATKLLRYSFLSGLVFMVLLAIVFLPRMFPDQRPVAVIRETDWRFDTTNGTKLFIGSITASLELSRFRANFSVDRPPPIASLGPGLANGTATLRFVDANADGLLDAGDYFAVSPPPTGCYRLEVFQIDVGKLAGFKMWGACPSATFN